MEISREVFAKLPNGEQNLALFDAVNGLPGQVAKELGAQFVSKSDCIHAKGSWASWLTPRTVVSGLIGLGMMGYGVYALATGQDPVPPWMRPATTVAAPK